MTDTVVLVLDTATRTPVAALAKTDGTLLGEQRWESRHRHGEELLGRISSLLDASSVGRRDLTAVVVGTGPGSFTGLRVGLATAKVLAYSLSVPLVGVSTTRALALAASAGLPADAVVAVSLPAGAVDRYVHRLRVDGSTVIEEESPRLVAGESAFAAATNGALVAAVDLDALDLPPDAVRLGHRAAAGLAATLATLGVVELNAGRTDDPAQLVPAYVALPRGLARAAAEMQWSPDLR